MNQETELTCKCKSTPKSWKGGDRKCAFINEVFSSDNWNCVTMNRFRDICEDTAVYSNDQYAVLLPIDNCDGFTHLFLGWYKHRGKTEQAFLVNDREIKPLTLKDAYNILPQFSMKVIRSER